MSGISSNCGTLDIVHCGIVELRIAWSLLFRDYTHGVILVTNALLQDHEFFIHAATTNKIFKYLKDFYNLEDKVGLHGVDSDISHVVWVQCLLACMFHNEGIIDYNKVVEVEMIEKIKHMILASKLGFVAALHQIVKWFQCALRHTRTAIKLAKGQIQYISSWDSLGGIFCVIDMNYIRQGLLPLFDLQFREILFSCDVKLADLPGSSWYLMFPYMNHVDKVAKCLIWKNKQFQFNFQIYWIPILLIKHMKRNKNTSCINAIISMLHGISKGVDSSKLSDLLIL
jgi:hypothetical protein